MKSLSACVEVELQLGVAVDDRSYNIFLSEVRISKLQSPQCKP